MSLRLLIFFILLLIFAAKSVAQERAFWSVRPLQPQRSVYWITTSYFEASEEFASAGFRRDLFRVATTDETSFPVTDARFIDRLIGLLRVFRAGRCEFQGSPNHHSDWIRRYKATQADCCKTSRTFVAVDCRAHEFSVRHSET